MATFKWFGNGLMKALTGTIDFDTDTFKMMLTTSTYVPNQDTHVFRSDVTNEVAASGTYATGGVSLGAATVTYDTATNEIRITWSSPAAITGFTGSVRNAVIYKSRGGASTADELVAFAAEASDVTATAGTLTLTLSNPVLKVTPAA